MDEYKSKLGEDLVEKLDKLELTCEQPDFFVAEYFSAIRNEIDLNTEQLIHKRGSGSSESIEKLNFIRTEFIQFLDKMEENLLQKLRETPGKRTSGSLCELRKRVEDFTASKETTSLIQMEETYLKLAVGIINASTDLETCLLDNQTIVYVSRIAKDSIGNLIYLRDDSLNREELNFLKTNKNSNSSHKSIHEAIQKSFNSSLLVKTSLPFVITRNTLIIYSIITDFHSFLGRIFFSFRNESHLLDSDFSGRRFWKIRTMQSFINEKGSSVESLRIPDHTWSMVSILLENNRMKNFQIDETNMRSIEKLYLSQNQLESLDDELMAKAAALKDLKLVEACIPGTKFSIGFLGSLAELKILEITLPDAPIDFDVFKNLKNMTRLKLYSASSQDANIQRPKLTINHFSQLSAMRQLRSLEMSHFEIESLDNKMLTQFDYLNEIVLNNNKIAQIDEAAFAITSTISSRSPEKPLSVSLKGNSISNLSPAMFRDRKDFHSVDLSYNRIKSLPSGLFAVELSSLRFLYLNHNSIGHLDRGAFHILALLETLRLDHNSIESIDQEAFVSLERLNYLSLSNNLLRAIDNNTFKSLKKLQQLDLSYNKIDRFEDVEESRPVEAETAFSSAQCSTKKERFLCGLERLKCLSLKGNKLEKLDLNCFSNLQALTELDLSSNRISELNEEFCPGVFRNLEKLDISDNKLVRISQHVLSKTTRLKVLNLSGNKLQELGEDFFVHFGSLERLELQGNDLSVNITAELFRNQFNSLTDINLLNNPRIRIDEKAFDKFIKLNSVQLDCSNSSLDWCQSLSYNKALASLSSISLANTSIEKISPFIIFPMLKFSSLSELDLSCGRFRIIDRDCLCSLPNLKHLSVAYNLIENLDDPNLFNVVPNLENLNLSGNNLKHIHRQLFKCLEWLQLLNLSCNPTLHNLDAGLFRGLCKLEQLNLSQNNIASFDLASLFRSCRLLRCLDLSNNQLDHESINETSMSGVSAQNLKELMLANNRLERMDFVRNLYRLEKLNLSGNKIESVTSNGVNFLGRLVKLSHVNLSNNHIQSLNVKAVFSHLKYQLCFIDLSNNPFNFKMPNQLSNDCFEFIDEYKV